MKPLTVSKIGKSIFGQYGKRQNSTIRFFPHILIYAILLLCTTGFSAYGSIYSDFTIISENSGEVEFVINIGEPSKYISFNEIDSTYSMVIPVVLNVPFGSVVSIARADLLDNKPMPSMGGFEFGQISLGQIDVASINTVRGRSLAHLNIYPSNGTGYASKIMVSARFVGSTSADKSSLETTTEGDIYERIFRNSVLNYRSSSAWPVYRKRSVASKAADDIFSQIATWYKVEITETGITRLTGSELSSAGLSMNFPSDNLHLFYGGGQPLPYSNYTPRPDFEEIAIEIFDGGDGVFNSGDSLYFFADAADRWIYPSDSNPYYVKNHYTDKNFYWLAVDGSLGSANNRIEEYDGAPLDVPDTVITDARFHRHEEENNFLLVDDNGRIFDYFTWYWAKTNQVNFYVPLYNVLPYDPDRPSDSTHILIGANASNSSISLRVNGINFVPRINGTFAPRFEFYYNDTLSNSGLNSFSLDLTDNYLSEPHFDYCDISYRGSLTPLNGSLDFVLDSVAGVANVTVEDEFSGSRTVYDISDPLRPNRIVNYLSNPGNIEWQQNLNGRGRYFLADQSRIVSPSQISEVNVAGLRSQTDHADLIVIAPQEFLSAIDAYVTYREQKSGLDIKVVELEDIYNEFSYGQFDPTAIRDYIKFGYDNFTAPAPSGVLLVGDGHYDFLNYLGNNRDNYMPPFIRPDDESASDDNYTYFGEYGMLDSDSSFISSDDYHDYDMMISRWPVNSAGDVATIINKIKNYESEDNLGSWRTNVTLVSDDDYAGSDYERLLHATQSEQLSAYHLPEAFERNKIFLWDYSLDSDGHKPSVNDIIVDAINDGTLLINYVGHGNPDVWAHERVFLRDQDLPRLTNDEKLALFFAASCSIGFFDDPSGEGMSEDLLRMSGGAIAVISAVRLVYSSDNASFNRTTYDLLFNDRDLTMCEAMFAAKLTRQYALGYPVGKPNDRKYAFFGDPCLKLGFPSYEIEYTDYPAEFKALDSHFVAGRIINPTDSSLVFFNGELEIEVHDSKINKVYQGERVGDSLVYSIAGPVIFKGKTEVVDGLFDFRFIAPLDIGYGGEGGNISGYALSATNDGFGQIGDISVSSEIAETTDSTGPQISYAFSTRDNFVSGDRISPGESLIISLTDNSGINLTGGSGHRISLTIDNDVENIVNLTDLFIYNPGSFTEGEVNYELGLLSAGMHSFKVKAWDNANNSTVSEFEAAVSLEGELLLSEVLNYPNPMETETMFSFNLSGPANSVSLEIFTVSGEKILSHKEFSVPADFNRFYSWNGHDADGDRVATGVYIYKITASSTATNEVVQSYGKVVVIN